MEKLLKRITFDKDILCGKPIIRGLRISVEMILDLLAKGATEKEMAEALHFSMPEDRLHPAMQTLQSYWTTLNKKKGIRLNVANRLWGQESYNFLDSFLRR